MKKRTCTLLSAAASVTNVRVGDVLQALDSGSMDVSNASHYFLRPRI
jgi:hypothetical protein